MVPVHETSLGFLRHPVFHQRRRDLILVASQLTALQQCAAVIEITVLVSLVEIGGQGHIQLQGGGLGRQNGEAVLTDDQRQGSAVVPLHVELPSIVDVVQSPCAARLQRGIRVFHLSELDPRTCGELFPQEVQPFFWC